MTPNEANVRRSDGGTPRAGVLFAAWAVAVALAAMVLSPAPASARVMDHAATTSLAREIPDPECTITGTARADVLRGTPGDDVICGLGGDDILRGFGGDDLLVGGMGRDQLLGGSGDDALDGGARPDRLVGGPGEDSCAASTGDETSPDCTTDAQGPEISDVDVPREVAAGSDITITWRVADASNVAAAYVGIGGRQGWMSWCAWLPARLSSGDERDGTYSVTCSVPQNTINDDFSVWIGAADLLGNATWLEAMASFTVTGGSDDLEAPGVSDVSMPASARPGETITITWRSMDATGVAGALVFLRGPLGTGVTLMGGPVELTSGSSRDGTYSTTVEIPSDGLIPQYDAYVWIGDEVNNRTVASLGTIVIG